MSKNPIQDTSRDFLAMYCPCKLLFPLKSSFWESGCSLFLFNIKERGFFSTLTTLHLPLHDLDSFLKFS